MAPLSSLALAASLAAAAAAFPDLGLGLARSAFSASPLSLNTSEYQFVLDGSIPIAADFDVVSVDLSYYGVPWASFLYQAPLPVSWATRLDAMVKAVDAYELPVFLQFALTGNDKRSCPASNATDAPYSTNPGVSDFSGCQRCFDFDVIRNPIASFIRQGYTNYALAVSLAFNATGTLGIINFGADANRYLESGCSALEWEAYVGFTAQVYATLKAVYPAMSISPSFSLETMMQAQSGQACEGTNWAAPTAPAALTACARAGYAALAGIPRDAFYFSAFPALPTAQSGGYRAWYLTAPLAQLTPAERASLVVANTGFPSATLSLNFANTSDYSPPLQCEDLVPSSPAAAAAWFTTLNSALTAPGLHAYVVNFKSARDVLFDGAEACPCVAPIPALEPYCAVLIAYRGACKTGGILPAACELAIKLPGSLGVRDLFGVPRAPLYNALQAARKLP
jgi:hypothetical protein